MIVSATVLPPFCQKPLLPMVKPAAFMTDLAAVTLLVAETVIELTGPLQAEKAGIVRPVALVTGFSSPASPSAPSTLRLTARLIALRTASWLVGHRFRFGSKLSS